MPTGTSRPQPRQDGAACACTSILRCRACRLLGAGVLAPLPPMRQRHRQQSGPVAPQAFPRFGTPTDPAATLSSAVDFPALPVRRPPLLRRLPAGMRRAAPVACCVRVPMPSLPPRRSGPPPPPVGDGPCCRRLHGGRLGLRGGHVRGHLCVRWRYDLETRPHPADEVVERLQSVGCPSPCAPTPGRWLFPWQVCLLLNTPAFAGHTTGRDTFASSGSPEKEMYFD